MSSDSKKKPSENAARVPNLSVQITGPKTHEPQITPAESWIIKNRILCRKCLMTVMVSGMARSPAPPPSIPPIIPNPIKSFYDKKRSKSHRIPWSSSSNKQRQQPSQSKIWRRMHTLISLS